MLAILLCSFLPFTYIHCVHINRYHWVFHNNVYKYARIFMIFGTQLCNWILIILVIYYVACHVHPLPGDVILTSLKSCHSPCTWQSPSCRERRQEFIPPEMWPSSLPDWNMVDYSIWGILQETVYRSRIHDVKELQEYLLREWKLLDHTIIVAVIAQWHSHLNACVMRERWTLYTYIWASDFLLCFVCFIDTGSRKCDRYKHVQSANIVLNVLLLCLDTFTRYGSNITNVLQEILTPMTLTFSGEVAHEKLWKSINMCKSCGEKISGIFFMWTRCTLIIKYSVLLHAVILYCNVQQGGFSNTAEPDRIL